MMTEVDFAVAIFPFLKTSAPVRIGGHIFRSTLDTDGLPAHQATAIRELSQMLFVQGDLRVKSASYAILPTLEVHSADLRLTHLAHLRDVVAYLYAAPHDVFENVFLPPEEISLALFTPSRVSLFLTRPEHHTESASPLSGPQPDLSHYVPGYNGLYNFRHSFWVEPGSRLYGPKPHMILNISQDLHTDFEHRMAGLPHHHLLLDLLEKPEIQTSLRIFSALHWFNAANEAGISYSQALLSLAVAFETLLRLPESSKTDRLVDAISLLLGRTERLDEWAQQFYTARSEVAHEDATRDRYFYVNGNRKRQTSDVSGSLMLYGRQIFQLCVGTLLVGIDLAERADLREKFIANNERYQQICQLLERKVVTASARLLSLAPTVRALERYRFVASGIEPGPQLAAVRLAANALVECNQSLPEDVANAVSKCAAGKRADGEFQQLSAIEAANAVFQKQDLSILTPEARTVRDIIHLVWMSLFMRYVWLKNKDYEGKS
jgi:Apea-like HEPN